MIQTPVRSQTTLSPGTMLFSGFGYIHRMWSPMTAILAWADWNDVYIAADGLAAPRMTAMDEYVWKVARINDNAAIGVAGPEPHTWMIIARVLGIPVPGDRKERCGIVRLAESAGYNRPDLGLAGICELIDTYDVKMHTEPGEQPEALVVVVSTFDKHPTVTFWHGNVCWERQSTAFPAIFSPGSIETLTLVRWTLLCGQLSPTQRAEHCFRLLAVERSDLVNENFTLRRASTGFALETPCSRAAAQRR